MRGQVVICLKNRTFAVSQTTQSINPFSSLGLWFAWKIVLLQYRKQRSAPLDRISVGCDLLEKSYFCSIANNTSSDMMYQAIVVICLKNRTFAVSQTTSVFPHCCHPLLWFAWKIVLLQYRKQQAAIQALQQIGCDLLEKSYFCSIANNCSLLPITARWVVICLKNRTFAVSQTTGWQVNTGKARLWFAWKIVLLQYRKQHSPLYYPPHRRCDLLEKSYFCSIANNKSHRNI